jgi:hypothetical protein
MCVCVYFDVSQILVRKSHALPFILRYEFYSVHVNLLDLTGDDQIYFIIIIIRSVFVRNLLDMQVICFLIVNLDTMPLKLVE